ncbi:MAG: hypothetical protein NT066_02130 [Candidatus Omnitrophica bacterium]|nr:hypothetical protein [Candidatus Omnitrophota bacterium]
MNKRGIILIFSLLVALVLITLIVSFYFQSINENWFARKYAGSVRALWLAEAGIAKVQSELVLRTTALDGSIDDSTYTSYNVTAPAPIGATGYYTILSTGTVRLPSDEILSSRTVNVTMKVIPPDASKFAYCVETTGDDLVFKDKNLINTENSTNIAKSNSTQTLPDLFGVSKATMEAGAGTYYQSPNSSISTTLNVTGVTWVDVTDADGELAIEHLNGNGTLIISGNFRMEGVGNFNGILYVIGALTMRGNPTINGTVFAESSADIDIDISGSSLVNYNSSNIAKELGSLSNKTIVSWKEN